MTQILDTRKFQSKSMDTPISFEHIGPYESSGLFTRIINLQGQRAYELSFSCDTCYFLFKRLEGAVDVASVEAIGETLRNGITSIDDQLLNQIAPIIPKGNYIINLLEVTPELVAPLSSKDYFSHEQVELWGIDPYWCLPHYPQTEYYRTHTQKLANKEAFFEFVIPMTPKNWLKTERFEEFEKKINEGMKPTALAISVLDTKQPADWENEPAITKHICFAHFLLDGHHKMFAANRVKKSISLLSFLSIDESISTIHGIDSIQKLLLESHETN